MARLERFHNVIEAQDRLLGGRRLTWPIEFQIRSGAEWRRGWIRSRSRFSNRKSLEARSTCLYAPGSNASTKPPHLKPLADENQAAVASRFIPLDGPERWRLEPSFSLSTHDGW
jgi:hypothetical protein